MNTEIEKFGPDHHPDENLLLQALERELSTVENANIEQHLGSCWSCRARFHEIERGILVFVEYREKRYIPSLASPPHDYRSFPSQLRNAEASRTSGLLRRIWGRLQTLFNWPAQVRWVSATAAVVAIVVFWTQVLFNPETVSASEFLARAAAAQNTVVSQGKSNARSTVRQRVRISNGPQSVTRDFEWILGTPIAHAQWPMQEDLSAWNAPLTAEGFAAWRNSTGNKKDRVKRSGEQLTLDTTAKSSTIREAWMIVRAGDFHPVEQHIRFADDRQLDFQELSFETILPVQQHEGAVAQNPPHPPIEPRNRVPSVPLENLDETELQVRYLMFAQGWDLGEDFAISRVAGAVRVSGTASTPEGAKSIETALSNLKSVRVEINAPGAPRQAPASNSSPTPRPASSTPLLRAVLEQTYDSPEQMREFVDRCLEASDNALSHAWALKTLVDRYSEAQQKLLTADSQAKLGEMLRAHLQKLGDANASLNPLIAILPESRTRNLEAPSDWRPAILALFTLVQEQDTVVASLLVGTQSSGTSVEAASERLRSTHAAIASLLNRLQDLDIR